MEVIFIIGGITFLGFVFQVSSISSGGGPKYEVVDPSYKCPKCGGSDYFMSTRNVMKGMGGIWGNRGALKKFPVCKVCDEIMEGQQ